MKWIFFSMGIATLFAACSKPNFEDKEPPVATITGPSDNANVDGSQKIYISGTAKDNRYVKQIHIEVTNFFTGAEAFHVHIHPGTANAVFNEAFDFPRGVSYRIRVLVDDASTNTSVPVSIRVNVL